MNMGDDDKFVASAWSMCCGNWGLQQLPCGCNEIDINLHERLNCGARIPLNNRDSECSKNLRFIDDVVLPNDVFTDNDNGL